MFVLRLMQWTESQAVHCRNRPGAHGENIPEDSADTGCGALERLDKRWMVMGFDLESNGEPVADIDDSRILAPDPEAPLVPSSATGANARASSCSCSARSTS